MSFDQGTFDVASRAGYRAERNAEALDELLDRVDRLERALAAPHVAKPVPRDWVGPLAEIAREQRKEWLALRRQWEKAKSSPQPRGEQ